MGPTHALSAWFFVRALSLVYLIAFFSLAMQVHGLFGEHGVLPIAEHLKTIESNTDLNRYWQVPSIFWMNSSDEAILGVAVAGILYAGLALIGFAQGWMLLLCFILYLSFVNTGQDFMSFQWDILLLELGFLSLFVVPWRFQFQLNLMEDPHWAIRGMFYLVLFKLMFLSGVVKLTSGDLSWRDMSALTYHYWTQPLPNPLAPFIHFLPKWMHHVATFITFVIELGLPFFIFIPSLRFIPAVGFTLLSVSILLTGNYTFFNWLTLALCIWLASDTFWEKIDLSPLNVMTIPSIATPPPVTTTALGLLLVLNLIWTTRWFYPSAVLEALEPFHRAIRGLHISSPYGLFAVMTKNRPEIIIEGSTDGENWREYQFKYKPSSIYRMPPIVAPHQPRLDWQMWFAALGPLRQNAWFEKLLIRLFQNSPEVTQLLEDNPFSNESPRFLRARIYEYEFTSVEDILMDGKWWQRRLVGEYSPVFKRP